VLSIRNKFDRPRSLPRSPKNWWTLVH